MKSYLILRYHILVLLVHLCILPIIHAQTLLFFVNLLERYSSAPTQRHWNGIKHIFRYLRGTTDMGLFYSRESKQQLLGYVNVGYLSYPHKGRSQTKYVFNCNGTAISWRFVKQTIVTTLSNHSKILTIHKASCECI